MATNAINSTLFSNSGRVVTFEDYPVVLKRAEKHVEMLTDRIANHNFVTETITFLDNEKERVVVEGEKEDALQRVQAEVDALLDAQALITRLKTAKSIYDEAVSAVESTCLEDFCKSNGISLKEPVCLEDYLAEKGMDYPESPEQDRTELTMEEAEDELDIKTRARLLTLDATAAAIGSSIHPGGSFAQARDLLMQSLTAPGQLQGYGQVPVVTSTQPSVSVDKVNEVFFDLQAQHRCLEAEVNRIKQNLDQRIREDKLMKNQAYKEELVARQAKLEPYMAACEVYHNEVEIPYLEDKHRLQKQLEQWRTNELEKLASLSIAIPQEMEDTLNMVNRY